MQRSTPRRRRRNQPARATTRRARAEYDPSTRPRGARLSICAVWLASCSNMDKVLIRYQPLVPAIARGDGAGSFLARLLAEPEQPRCRCCPRLQSGESSIAAPLAVADFGGMAEPTKKNRPRHSHVAFGFRRQGKKWGDLPEPAAPAISTLPKTTSRPLPPSTSLTPLLSRDILQSATGHTLHQPACLSGSTGYFSIRPGKQPVPPWREEREPPAYDGPLFQDLDHSSALNLLAPRPMAIMMMR